MGAALACGASWAQAVGVSAVESSAMVAILENGDIIGSPHWSDIVESMPSFESMLHRNIFCNRFLDKISTPDASVR
jgi:hypothetical protein